METNEGEHLSQQPTVNVKTETEKDVPSGHTCGVYGRGLASKAKDSNVMENSGETEGSSICSICGQVFPQALLLKSHMKTYCGSEDYRCRICGRRFRKAWFLQSHMRVHQAKAQLKGDSEPPATINGVPQDPASLRNEVCLYELCGICGNFFPDLNALQIHEKLHKGNHNYAETQPTPQGDTKASDMQTAMIRFMAAFNLKPVAPKEAEEKKLGGRIPQLDPITSYQALQLATRGRLATINASALKYLGRVKEKKKRVPVKKEKRKRTKTPGPKNKKVKRDTDLHQTSKGTAQPKGGGEKNCQKSDIPLNGLGHAFYEEDTQSSSVNSKYQEAAPRSQRTQPPDIPAHSSGIKHVTRLQSGTLKRKYLSKDLSSYGPQSSWEREQPQKKSEHKQQRVEGGSELSTDQTSSSSSMLSGNSASSFQPVTIPKHHSAPDELNFPREVKTEDLVKHQCPYCSHTSYSPEVLWMHQRVAHKVECSSSVAPKWAPCTYSPKSSKAGTGPVRRTGPPLFLEGKDCPPLPAPRSQRTQPPDFPGHSSR